MSWSKTQKRLYSVMLRDELDLQLHCTVYPIRSGRKGKGNKEGMPRYWFTLGKEVIWDWPKDFKDKTKWQVLHGYGFNKETRKHEEYSEGGSYHCTVIGRLLRDYLDTPKSELRNKEFVYDNYGFTDILKVADKRLGRRSLDTKFLFKINPVAKRIAEKRLGFTILNYHPQAHEWLKEFKELHPNREILFFYKAGSHFFDLNTPNSDLDYRGVYLPAPEEFEKNKWGKKENRRKQFERKTNDEKHTQNSNDDVDFLLFSFTKVLELLKGGDFNMMEMLFTPEDKILIDSPLMKELRGFRENLLVNDVSSFLGFIKKEYTRYGVNINHYGAQVELLDFLKELAKKQEKGVATRLREVWKDLKEYGKDEPLIHFTQSLTGNSTNVPTLKVAQRMYQWTVKLSYVIDALEYRIKMYGHRQKKMAETGKEFKGLYHALRLIYEAQDLFDLGVLELPFTPERLGKLMAIKTGTMKQEKVHELIDAGIEDIFKREKETPSNKHIVDHRIDKILSTFQGRMDLMRVLRRYE